MRSFYAVLSAVILALASGTVLARDHGGGGGHAGGFAGHAVGGQMSGGHGGGRGAGFSSGQFARGNAGGQFISHGSNHGFHAGPRFGVVVSSPLFVDPYYYPPVYLPAPAYYCASAGTYYPDVPYCPEGWQRVVPQAALY